MLPPTVTLRSDSGSDTHRRVADIKAINFMPLELTILNIHFIVFGFSINSQSKVGAIIVEAFMLSVSMFMMKDKSPSYVRISEAAPSR